MADNYIGNKMDEYFARPAVTTNAAKTSTVSPLARLLLKNRSCRGYDTRFEVRADQLRRIIGVCTKIPSARNQQVLRFRAVLSDEADKVLPHIHLGGALPELHLPLPQTEPRAFIIVCSIAEESRDVDIDLGIAAQSMLLQATEIGLNGLCIGAFDKERIQQGFALAAEPLLIIAIGKSCEKICLTEIAETENHKYYRRDGVHYVPKLRLDELMIK